MAQNAGEYEALLSDESYTRRLALESAADIGENWIHSSPLDSAARASTTAEHELSLRDAVKQYPQAIFWSLFFSLAVLMAGFDAQLVTSLYALPAFQRRFGYEHDGRYIISAAWQMALGMVSLIHSLRKTDRIYYTNGSIVGPAAILNLGSCG